MSLGTLVAFFGMTVSFRDARAFHVTSMRILMTKLSSVTILLQNNLEKPRVVVRIPAIMDLIIIIIIIIIAIFILSLVSRSFLHQPQGVNTPNFRTTPQASSPDNPPNRSQGLLNVAFAVFWGSIQV